VHIVFDGAHFVFDEQQLNCFLLSNLEGGKMEEDLKKE
jgi:hypothetical protein